MPDPVILRESKSSEYRAGYFIAIIGVFPVFTDVYTRRSSSIARTTVSPARPKPLHDPQLPRAFRRFRGVSREKIRRSPMRSPRDEFLSRGLEESNGPAKPRDQKIRRRLSSESIPAVVAAARLAAYISTTSTVCAHRRRHDGTVKDRPGGGTKRDESSAYI